MSYSIRPMEDKDMKTVLEIENLCFTAPWKEQDILIELHENPLSNFSVIEIDELNLVVGFANYWHTFDSATLCQIAVHPNYQHKHLGSLFLEDILKECHAKKVRNLTLEVRKNNAKAISFYKKFGFKDVLIKPHYYSNGDDAIYMINEVEL